MRRLFDRFAIFGNFPLQQSEHSRQALGVEYKNIWPAR